MRILANHPSPLATKVIITRFSVFPDLVAAGRKEGASVAGGDAR